MLEYTAEDALQPPRFRAHGAVRQDHFLVLDQISAAEDTAQNRMADHIDGPETAAEGKKRMLDERHATRGPQGKRRKHDGSNVNPPPLVFADSVVAAVFVLTALPLVLAEATAAAVFTLAHLERGPLLLLYRQVRLLTAFIFKVICSLSPCDDEVG